VSVERLGAIGITTVAQVAAWSDADVDAVAARINVSPERIRREDWVGQARAAVKD
jgi:predicted flap endonuclease-1-like 5' DNA nuclease